MKRSVVVKQRNEASNIPGARERGRVIHNSCERAQAAAKVCGSEPNVSMKQNEHDWLLHRSV
jgi:hypothetical protein